MSQLNQHNPFAARLVPQNWNDENRQGICAGIASYWLRQILSGRRDIDAWTEWTQEDQKHAGEYFTDFGGDSLKRLSEMNLTVSSVWTINNALSYDTILLAILNYFKSESSEDITKEEIALKKYFGLQISKEKNTGTHYYYLTSKFTPFGHESEAKHAMAARVTEDHIYFLDPNGGLFSWTYRQAAGAFPVRMEEMYGRGDREWPCPPQEFKIYEVTGHTSKVHGALPRKGGGKDNHYDTLPLKHDTLPLNQDRLVLSADVENTGLGYVWRMGTMDAHENSLFEVPLVGQPDAQEDALWQLRTLMVNNNAVSIRSWIGVNLNIPLAVNQDLAYRRLFEDTHFFDTYVPGPGNTRVHENISAAPPDESLHDILPAAGSDLERFLFDIY